MRIKQGRHQDFNGGGEIQPKIIQLKILKNLKNLNVMHENLKNFHKF